VCHGRSNRLSKRALRDLDYTLADMIVDGRKQETSQVQATGIDSQFRDISLKLKKLDTRSQKHCFNCGYSFPHKGKPCPARNATCSLCARRGHFAKMCRSKQATQTSRNTQPPRRHTEKPAHKRKPQRKQHARALQDPTSSSNSDTSSDDEFVYALEHNERDPRTRVTLLINSVATKLTVDTGATIDLTDSNTYENLKHKVSLHKSHTKVYSYGSNTPLKLKGQFQAQIETKKQFAVSQIHVSCGSGRNLLSAKTAQDLGLIQIVNKISLLPEQSTHNQASGQTCAPSKGGQSAFKATPSLSPIIDQNWDIPTQKIRKFNKS